MEKEKTAQQKAEESLKKVMQEGETPSVENLMLALNQAKVMNNQLRAKLAQLAEGCRDLELRLGASEFQHRLEFLWKVLFTAESKTVFGNDFVEKCKKDFEEMLFPVPQEPVKDNE